MTSASQAEWRQVSFYAGAAQKHFHLTGEIQRFRFTRVVQNAYTSKWTFCVVRHFLYSFVKRCGTETAFKPSIVKHIFK